MCRKKLDKSDLKKPVGKHTNNSEYERRKKNEEFNREKTCAVASAARDCRQYPLVGNI
jgi:hypothetical protein